MSKENLSEWDKQKLTTRLKKAIKNSKTKCFAQDYFEEWFDTAESLGYHLLFDHCQSDHPSVRFRNFRVAQVVEL